MPYRIIEHDASNGNPRRLSDELSSVLGRERAGSGLLR